MLKSCFLPTSCPNYYNRTCGEIIYQTETSFIITCKVCDIKIFHYDEFIKHFRNTHWPEIYIGDNHQAKEEYNSVFKKNEWDGILQDENRTKRDVNGALIEETLNTAQNKCPASDIEDIICTSGVVNEENDSEDIKPLVIMKRDSRKTLETTKERSFECGQCKRKFTTKFYLRFHMRQQHEPKTFQCDKCSKSFVEKRYLTLHQRSHVGYICKICHKVFDKYEALRYHGESHIQTKNFLCDYEKCGKAFPNNRRLSAHKRSHFAQPSFVCEICGSRQRSKEFLIVHIRTHTGEKPYACNQCDRRFASKHFLQDHQSVHATERSHVCTVCGKTFASSKSLYHHRHLHSSIKKYVCKICNSAYSQAAGLSAHMRKHKQDCVLLDSEQTVVCDQKFS